MIVLPNNVLENVNTIFGLIILKKKKKYSVDYIIVDFITKSQDKVQAIGKS